MGDFYELTREELMGIDGGHSLSGWDCTGSGGSVTPPCFAWVW